MQSRQLATQHSGVEYRLFVPPPCRARCRLQRLDDGVNLRRARIGVIGKFWGDWDYALIYDFGRGSSQGNAAAPHPPDLRYLLLASARSRSHAWRTQLLRSGNRMLKGHCDGIAIRPRRSQKIEGRKRSGVSPVFSM
jgi:hypothetical protein